MQGVSIEGQELLHGGNGRPLKSHAVNTEGYFKVRSQGGWEFRKFSVAEQAWVDARSKTVDGKRVWI